MKEWDFYLDDFSSSPNEVDEALVVLRIILLQSVFFVCKHVLVGVFGEGGALVLLDSLYNLVIGDDNARCECKQFYVYSKAYFDAVGSTAGDACMISIGACSRALVRRFPYYFSFAWGDAGRLCLFFHSIC